MEDTPLISVVVPVYGVEEYLPRCVESILDQSYPRLEVLLVDDGSPDRCGEICDRYAALDSRVRVIHQENRGLSAARNAGIRQAQGEWIGFVDSDDWIDRGMYEALLRAAQLYGGEVAICQFCYRYPDGSFVTKPAQFFQVSGHRAVELLLAREGLEDYACNKLFLARLFWGIQYPEGQVFEDISTTYRLLERASRVVNLSHQPGAQYNYLQRGTGIVRSATLPNELDCFRAKWNRYRELREQYPAQIPVMKGDLAASAAKVWGVAWKDRHLGGESARQQLGEISAFVRKNYPTLCRVASLGVTGRMTLALARFDRGWSRFLGGLLRRLYLIKHRR